MEKSEDNLDNVIGFLNNPTKDEQMPFSPIETTAKTSSSIKGEAGDAIHRLMERIDFLEGSLANIAKTTQGSQKRPFKTNLTKASDKKNLITMCHSISVSHTGTILSLDLSINN